MGTRAVVAVLGALQLFVCMLCLQKLAQSVTRPEFLLPMLFLLLLALLVDTLATVVQSSTPTERVSDGMAQLALHVPERVA